MGPQGPGRPVGGIPCEGLEASVWESRAGKQLGGPSTEDSRGMGHSADFLVTAGTRSVRLSGELGGQVEGTPRRT